MQKRNLGRHNLEDSMDEESGSPRGEPRHRIYQLTADDLREIDRASSQITVHARYPEQLRQIVGR